MKPRIKANFSIMFADISDGARLQAQLGDNRAHVIISQVLASMRQITEDYQGRVIKTMPGDKILCIFPSPKEAALAALAMQENAGPALASSQQVSIRVGFHHGEVIEEGNDVFGDAVNLAARMLSQAKPDQIVATGEVVTALPKEMRASARWLITTTVKGKQQPIDIYELTWGEEKDLTFSPSTKSKSASKGDSLAGNQPRLRISWQQQHLEMSEELPALTMGRDAQNLVCVPDVMASRTHVRIELHRQKFVITDQSTNGTYLLTDAGKEYFLHRDGMILEASGVIGIGKAVDANDPDAVRYLVVTD